MKKLTKKDQVTIINAYNKKIEEYGQMSLEELKSIYPKLGGTYKYACEIVVQRKLQLEKNDKLQEAINDVKLEQSSILKDGLSIEEVKPIINNIESNESSTS